MAIRERFWENTKVNKETGCVEWQRSLDSHGYGKLRINGKKSTKAHRFAWEMVKGPIHGGMSVLHKCDNPKCCNPEHLFLGTQKENMEDMTQKGRRRSVIPPQQGEKNNSAKLTKEDVFSIKNLLNSKKYSHSEIAKIFSISRTSVTLINTNKTWKDV